MARKNVGTKVGKRTAKKVPAKTRARAKNGKVPVKQVGGGGGRNSYPRQSAPKAIRIARAILEQNAGQPVTKPQAAAFLGLSSTGAGNFGVEISSGVKYGFLDQPGAGKIQPTPRARKVLKPQSPNDVIDGYREAVLAAPVISEVYQRYRGENLPDDPFFANALADSHNVQPENFAEFKQIFLESLEAAELLERHGEKIRLLDVSDTAPGSSGPGENLRKLERATNVSATDTCFVMQPFASPLGDYYEKIYKPAIEKAGLTPIRADTDIFATGKIMDQVWTGINAAKVLVAELTSRNPNVFYELGLAHAMKKPVVLVSAKEDDVPFDLQHIRVIYYDMADPFWGQKLLDKVAENVLSAIQNPEEAIFSAPV
jgi:hypothetical protein